MQDDQPDKNLQQEKKLSRRWWQGLLLIFIVIVILALTPHSFDITNSIDAQGNISPASIFLSFVLNLVVYAGIIAVVVLALRWYFAGERQRFRRGTEVLQRILPNLPLNEQTKYAEKVFSGKLFAQLIAIMSVWVIAIVLLVIAIDAGLERLWPDAPGWVSTAVSLVISFPGILFVYRLIEKQWGTRDRPAAPPFKRYAQALRNLILGAPLGLLLLGLATVIDRLAHSINPTLAGLLSFVFFTLGFGSFLAAYTFNPHFWIMAAVKRGEYEQAIRRVQRVEKSHWFRAEFLNMHGNILLWAGRFEEAEPLFKASIGEGRKEAMGADTATALGNLGCALVGQGKYAAAIEAFEGAIRIKPNLGFVYADLAEPYLQQGTEAQRALELTERAMKYYLASFEARRLNPQTLSRIWANQAWAYALLNRHTEAAAALQQAFATVPHNFRMAMARVHQRAGQVMMLRGERSQAAEHFRQGQLIDPNGYHGRECTQALNQI